MPFRCTKVTVCCFWSIKLPRRNTTQRSSRLELSGAPAEITQGESATVTVNKYSTAGVGSAANGVSVKGGEATVTTNASGQATVKFSTIGTAHLRGTKSGFAPTSSVAVCVHASGGHC